MVLERPRIGYVCGGGLGLLKYTLKIFFINRIPADNDGKSDKKW
jgi:hypothetical protein